MSSPINRRTLIAGGCSALPLITVPRVLAAVKAETAVPPSVITQPPRQWGKDAAPDVFPDPDVLPKAPLLTEVFAPRNGYVHGLAALPIGLASVHLGGGRRAKDDAIDPSVGIVCLKKRGDAVEEGEPLAEIHARDKTSAGEAARDVLAAYTFGDDEPSHRPIVLETIA